jgi:hypothetical protein
MWSQLREQEKSQIQKPYLQWNKINGSLTSNQTKINTKCVLNIDSAAATSKNERNTWIRLPSKLGHLKRTILGTQNYLLLQVFEICTIVFFGVRWKPYCAAAKEFNISFGKKILSRRWRFICSTRKCFGLSKSTERYLLRPQLIHCYVLRVIACFLELSMADNFHFSHKCRTNWTMVR